MKARRTAAALDNLRNQPLWRLLAATKGPVFIALLQSLFLDVDKVLPSSVMHERLVREIDALRADGEELPQTAQAYVTEWLNNGWLSRRFPPGASEEEYELSADALTALRFVTSLLKPRTTATESRLSLVIQQLSRLAAETNVNPEARLVALRAERERIDEAIAEVEHGGIKILPVERAIERAREVIALAQELTSDFRSVRDEFEKLNRGLRQSLMENEGSRGEVLEQLFAGVDIIGESDAGRTFNAFWRLLTDSEQSATLRESLDEVANRPFARDLESHERRFLLSLTGTLLNEGRGVHDVLQHFARSLKSFVQSREFLEQRRLHSLLKEATQAAFAAKNAVRSNEQVGFELMQSSSRIRSVAQWVMYDPAQRVTDSSMKEAEPSELDLETVSELVRQSEIDFRTLKQNVRAVLDRRTQASVGDVLAAFPAEQGLGSVVGYVALGARHGEVTEGSEIVRWTGDDLVHRRAKLPAIYFIRERYLELVE
ncbi:hypothetical protein EOS_34560 [Caballeronia mineralivorans PML1(12)]|uniref:DUF3375 domain-containing protein n=1 Tax=Caballeronia mineralivorans PML1(12) TaxID=908627 RepID=A0A0J1FPI5_9BURK|nr:DUF3375 domain-containing protein [Caballeronia mineralivorans]KLU21648.1 hypothetical protein EOS_34560 [Caballeronia mineralivorans PML1(12)]